MAYPLCGWAFFFDVPFVSENPVYISYASVLKLKTISFNVKCFFYYSLKLCKFRQSLILTKNLRSYE